MSPKQTNEALPLGALPLDQQIHHTLVTGFHDMRILRCNEIQERHLLFRGSLQLLDNPKPLHEHTEEDLIQLAVNVQALRHSASQHNQTDSHRSPDTTTQPHGNCLSQDSENSPPQKVSKRLSSPDRSPRKGSIPSPTLRPPNNLANCHQTLKGPTAMLTLTGLTSGSDRIPLTSLLPTIGPLVENCNIQRPKLSDQNRTKRTIAVFTSLSPMKLSFTTSS